MFLGNFLFKKANYTIFVFVYSLTSLKENLNLVHFLLINENLFEFMTPQIGAMTFFIFQHYY